MREQSIAEKRVYIDKVSGKDFHRPQYQKMLKHLKRGDQLCVASIDRLGRNYEEIQRQWRLLTREMEVDIFVLDMPLLDTRRDKDLLGTFISDLVLQVLSFVAHSERDNIRRRQAEGIAAAKVNGVRFGRVPSPLPQDFPEIHKRWREGMMSTVEAARHCGMARSTFRLRVIAFEKKK